MCPISGQYPKKERELRPKLPLICFDICRTGSFSELLIELSRLSVHSYARKRKEEIVHFINSYLEHHYTDPLNIDKIAEEIGYSRGYLFSFYKQKTGTTIGRNLQDIRLNHAKQLLRESDFPVEKICYRCGFSDISNFYRMFKKQTGESPTGFRKKTRACHR